MPCSSVSTTSRPTSEAVRLSAQVQRERHTTERPRRIEDDRLLDAARLRLQLQISTRQRNPETRPCCPPSDRPHPPRPTHPNRRCDHHPTRSAPPGPHPPAPRSTSRSRSRSSPSHRSSRGLQIRVDPGPGPIRPLEVQRRRRHERRLSVVRVHERLREPIPLRGLLPAPLLVETLHRLLLRRQGRGRLRHRLLGRGIHRPRLGHREHRPQRRRPHPVLPRRHRRGQPSPTPTPAPEPSPHPAPTSPPAAKAAAYPRHRQHAEPPDQTQPTAPPTQHQSPPTSQHEPDDAAHEKTA